MNDDEREMDLTLAELETENRMLRARNERLEREADEIYNSGWNTALEMAATRMQNELQRSMGDTAASFAAYVRGCKK